MKLRLLVGAVVLVAAAFVLLLGSRSSDGDALAALQADPLATWAPGRLAGWDRSLQTATPARKGRPAFVRNGFVVPRDDDRYDAAIEAARNAGWTIHEIDRAAISPPVRRTATGRRRTADGRELRGVIVLTRGERKPPATDELTVELTAVPSGD